MTTIQLTGLDDVRKVKRREGYVVLYGKRMTDAANRLVGVAVNEHEATDLMNQARYIGTMPQIEVDDRYWFYVASVRDAVWEEGKEPTA